jgi:hypothetical protein
LLEATRRITLSVVRISSIAYVCLLAFLSASLRAESIEQRNLAEGKIVLGSVSPDGKFCLLDVNVGDTTAKAVIIATSDRRKNLVQTQVHSERSMVRPQTNRVAILWAPDNKRVAIHDALAKHSAIAIYRLTGEQFEKIEVHDLLQAACAQWGITRDALASSGQRPVRWSAEDIVSVEVSARAKNGQQLRTTFPVHAPLEGKPVPQ